MEDSGYRPDGGPGCLTYVAALLIVGFALMMMSGGDHTTNANANVEAFSRNQANIASKVYNNYYDCLAAGSCVTYTTQTTTSTNSTRMDINGDGNTIRYTDYGRPICPNPNNPNEAGDVAEWCAAIGVQMP